MGRHMIVSSPLRSPAVVLGVPIATVLATMGSTAVLGGVVPSAEEMPLRAESAVAEALPGPPSWPSSWSPTSTDGIDAGTAGAGAGLLDGGPGSAGDAATGTIRVVQVPDEPTARSAAAPRAGGIRVVHEGPERTAERGDDVLRESADVRDGMDEPVARALRTPTTASAVARQGSGPVSSGPSSSVSSVSSRSDPPTDGVERVSAASAVAPSDRAVRSEGSADEGGLVDLDTPARGLSVLSFG